MPFPSTLAKAALTVVARPSAQLIPKQSVMIRRVHVQSSFNFLHEVLSDETDTKAAREDDKSESLVKKAPNKPTEFDVVLKYVNDRVQTRPSHEGEPISKGEAEK